MSVQASALPVAERIRSVRGHKVMLASDLAVLYGVETRALVQAVKRNLERFPHDFAFQLTEQELTSLRSQFVILDEATSRSQGRGKYAKYAPYAFTEQGVAMLSSVLKSKQAVRVNVEIMRAFVRMRDLVGHNREMTRRLNDLESKYDRQFKVVFDAIRELMTPPAPAPKRRIGFVQGE
jgi:hypothetical protein